jgi:hypothetical protein
MNALQQWVMKKLISKAVNNGFIGRVYYAARNAYATRIQEDGSYELSEDGDKYCADAFDRSQSEFWTRQVLWNDGKTNPLKDGFYVWALGSTFTLAAYGNDKWWIVKDKQWVEFGAAAGKYAGPVAPSDFQTPSAIEGSLAAKVMQQNALIQQLYSEIETLQASVQKAPRVGANLTHAAQLQVSKFASSSVPPSEQGI